jgi:hypothetical protein
MLMSFVAPPHDMPRYHGDAVRALLIVLAVLLGVAEAMGAVLPPSRAATVMLAVALVVAALITSPAQRWIHFVDAGLAGLVSLLFGSAVVLDYRARGEVTDPLSFVFALALMLVGFVALYLAIRTIRGLSTATTP